MPLRGGTDRIGIKRWVEILQHIKDIHRDLLAKVGIKRWVEILQHIKDIHRDLLAKGD
jgi:hypothetical protein